MSFGSRCTPAAGRLLLRGRGAGERQRLPLLCHHGGERGRFRRGVLPAIALVSQLGEQPVAQRLEGREALSRAREFRFEAHAFGLERLALVRRFPQQLFGQAVVARAFGSQFASMRTGSLRGRLPGSGELRLELGGGGFEQARSLLQGAAFESQPQQFLVARGQVGVQVG
ncbi:hypothetical protein [Paraburkholderia youngii]|uniref:hypothetical protein n=1 Tax=Paraburkholderia youngii TaxID=2782701 RepID=UPI003D1F41D0